MTRKLPGGKTTLADSVLVYEGPVSARSLGGAHRHFAGMAEALSLMPGPLVLILPSFRHEEELPLPHGANVQVIRVNSSWRNALGHVVYEARKLWVLSRVRRSARRGGMNVVMLSRLSTLGFATIVMSRTRMPVFVEVNGLPEFEYEHLGRSRLVTGMVGWLTRRQVSASSGCVAVTEGLRHAIQSRGAERVVRVENGAGARLTPRCDPRSRGRAWRIVYAGVLAPWQEVDVLLQALALLRSDPDAPPWHLVIIGDGREIKNLRRLSSRLGLDEEVSWLGWVDHAGVQREIVEAAVCVAPIRPTGSSLTGRSPLKVFEYLSLGRTVVTSLVDGTAELDDYPLHFYRQGDAQSLAEAVAAAVDKQGHGIDTPRNAELDVHPWQWSDRADRVRSFIDSTLDDRVDEAGGPAALPSQRTSFP